MQPRFANPNPSYSRDFGRFKKHLPILALFVLNPWAIGFVLICLAGVASMFSVHYGLSLVILILPFCSYYLERNLLERVLLPPFSIIAFYEAMGSGIGISLIIYANEGIFDPNLMKVQFAGILTLIVGWCFYRLGFGKIHKMHFPEQKGPFEQQVVRPLVWVGWFFLIYQTTSTVYLASVGQMDRGDFSLSSTRVAGQSSFGLWSIFGVFTRFNMFGFFLAPLIWRESNVFARTLILPLLGFYFLIALLSGSRGMFIHPLIIIGVGVYFFRSFRSAKIDIMALFLFIAVMPLIVLVDAFRTTDAYNATRTTDIAGRLAAFGDAFEAYKGRKEDAGGRDKYRVLGASMLGRSDYILYDLGSRGEPHVGFERFNAIIYTFVPTFFNRNKPVLLDSNLIYWNYFGKLDKTGRGMSLAADAYRRFGWFGVPFVIAFFFWLFGFICGRFYRIYFYKDVLFGMLLIMLTLSFFQSIPFSSVLESWWHLSYNLVKHFIGLYVGYWCLKKILNVRVRGGLYHYISHK